MLINAQNLATITRMINTGWSKGLTWKPPLDISFLFSDFASDGSSNFYPWMDFTGKYREWVGDRVFRNIAAQFYEIINRPWEKSESMLASFIKDDKWKVFVNLIQMHGSAWNQLKYDLVIEAITSNPVCFTGKPFFANDHEYGEFTIDNLTDQALSVASFEAAFTAAGNWQYSNGVYIRPNFTHLVHGPKLRNTAFNIVDAEKVDDGTGKLISNPNFKRATRVELPDFGGEYDDFWMLVDASQPVHAVALQIREEPNPIMDTDPVHVERSGKLDWMSSGRAASGPTFPHFVYGGRL